MDTRIFKEKFNLDGVAEVINSYIEGELLELEDEKVLEKWNYFSLMKLENTEIVNSFLETISYIDELSFSKYTKLRYILTLAYLVIKEKLNILSLDINNIFLLVSYLDDVDLKKIKSSLKYLNNEKLLFKIRIKSLDISYRKDLVRYVDNERKKVSEIIKFIDEVDYHELKELISV